MAEARLPEVVLVRKKYRVSKRAGRRKWKLKSMEVEEPDARMEAADKRLALQRRQEVELFMQVTAFP